jgi:hypothetical protein
LARRRAQVGIDLFGGHGGDTLCINPGSEANAGILRGYLVDIGRKGVELAQRVEG